MDLFAGQLDRVEFRVNRITASACMLIALALAVAWVYLAVGAPLTSHGIGDVAAAGSALVGAMVLLAAAVHITRFYILPRGAMVTIDERGIQDRRVGPYVLPWSHIHDIRLLDPHGYQVGVELDSRTLLTPPRRPTPFSGPMDSTRSGRVTVINTLFLRSAFRDRALGFLIPLTAWSPIDLNETPVSEAAQRADGWHARRQRRRLIAFWALTLVVPAAANSYRFLA